MKKKLLAFVTGAALLASAVSVPAYAAANVTLSDIKQHTQGTSVTIQGQSSYGDVIIKVIQPDNTILYFDDVTVTDGIYQTSFTLPSSAQVGEYKVVVGQGHNVASDTFTVVASAGSGSGGVIVPVNPPSEPKAGSNPTIPVVVKPGQSQQTVTPKTATEGSTVKASISDADLQKALNSSANAPVAVVVSVDPGQSKTAEFTLSPQQVKLISGTADSTLVATNGNASVGLPGSLLKNVDDEASIVISIGADNDAASTFTSQAAGASLAGTPVSYEVYLVKNGKSTPIQLQSSSYIKRSFIVDGSVDISKAGVLYIEDGVVRPVPASFTKNEDGTHTVVVNRPGFSTYTVATRNVSFTDIGTSYAKDRIQSLASKFLINGTTASTFSPKGKVTRAEFAAMLGRALGLQANSSAPFQDVHASDWFAKDVAAAYEAGLIQGVGSGQFQPNAQITRQDLTLMLNKAIQLLNLQKKADVQAVSYADAGQFASYSKDSIQTVTEFGLMTGEPVKGAYYFHPTDPATREAAASVLYFLLKNASIIN